MHATRSVGPALDRMIIRNRAMDHALIGGLLNEPSAWIPALDLIERKDAYQLVVDLPGVTESDMELVFEQNLLTIRGVKRNAFDPTTAGEVRVFTAERTSGPFQRSVRLPDSIDRAGIAAELAGGLLTITLPKAKEAQPRRIPINSPGRLTDEVAASSGSN